MARNTRIFSDIDMNFTMNETTGDIYKMYDENAIKNSLKNLVLTNNGERPFHSELGSPIRNLLFENYSPMLVLTIKRAIEFLVDNFEPRVLLVDVMVDPYEDDNEVVIGIFFRIRNTDILSSVSVTLDRVR